MSVNEKPDDRRGQSESLNRADDEASLETPIAVDEQGQSLAMQHFERGDVLMARRLLQTAENEEKRFLETALRWDPALWIACVLFVLIWLYATFATVVH